MSQSTVALWELVSRPAAFKTRMEISGSAVDKNEQCLEKKSIDKPAEFSCLDNLCMLA